MGFDDELEYGFNQPKRNLNTKTTKKRCKNGKF